MLQKALNELAQQIRIRARYDNFIGGTWVPPAKGQYFTNITPITGKPLCEIARSTAEDIETALDTAHVAKDKWGKASPAERAAVLLHQIAFDVEERRQETGGPERARHLTDLPR